MKKILKTIDYFKEIFAFSGNLCNFAPCLE